LKENLVAENIIPLQNEDFIADGFSPPTNVVFLGHALGSKTLVNKKNPIIRSCRQLLQRHLQNNKSVIMSSESFDLKDVKENYFAELVHGFQPIVVIFSRNWLSMMLSTYFQECRRLDDVIKRCQNIPQGVGKEVSFRTFLAHNSLLLTNASVLMYERSALHLAERYSRYFGAMNIRILDYDGLLAAGANVGEAFLELLATRTSQDFKTAAKQETSGLPMVNSAVSLDYTQVIRAAQHLQLSPSGCGNFKPDTLLPVDPAHPLPKQCLDAHTLQTLVKVSLSLDAQMRKKWGPVLVGGSREAAVAAIERAASSDPRRCWVDEEQFFASDFWLAWLKTDVASRCSANS
jgi:hypothetical protein